MPQRASCTSCCAPRVLCGVTKAAVVTASCPAKLGVATPFFAGTQSTSPWRRVDGASRR